MAKGKKKTTGDSEDNGVLNLIEYNSDIIENGSKTPNIMIDNFIGICIDENNYELVKIKQVLVTEDNIKSTTNAYEDKYKIGDTYQEWISMGRYPDSYKRAIEVYKELKFKKEASKLRYCTNVSELIEIEQNIKNDIYKFMYLDTVPEVISQTSSAIEQLVLLKSQVKQLQDLKTSVEKECNDLIDIVKGKRATMIAKGIIDNKKTKHRIKEEE